MKPRYLHNILFATLAALGLSACSDDNTPTPDPEPDNTPTLMSFSLSLDKSALSRADGDDNWGDIKPNDPDYENDYEFDNIVDQMTFRPVIYKVGNDGSLTKFVEVVPLTLLDPGQDANSSKISFAFTGMLPASTDAVKTDYASLTGKPDKYRLMVYTNGYTPSEGSIDENVTFSQIGNQGKPGFTAVPMWGVCEFSFQNLKKGEALPIGDIPLLRAMAMVRVQLADNFDGVQGSAPRDDVDLVSLTINRYNTDGLMAPNLWDKLSKTDQNTHFFASTLREKKSLATNYTIMADLSEPAQTAAETEGDGEEETTTPKKPIVMTIGDNGEEIYSNHPYVNREIITLYLPEIANSNTETETLYLTIGYRVRKGETRFTTIPFRNLLSSGTPTGEPITPGQTHYDAEKTQPVPNNAYWHIVRNHIYDYTISGVRDTELAIEAKVNDWQYHKAPPQDLER